MFNRRGFIRLGLMVPVAATIAERAEGAISYGSFNSGAFNQGGANMTLSLATSGSDRGLIVGIWGQNASDRISGVTYAGVPMTRITAFAGTNAGGWFYLYWLANPASGTNNVVVTCTQTYRVYDVSAACFAGVAPATPTIYGGNTAVSVLSISTTLVSTADNSWAFMLGNDTTGATYSAGAGTTKLSNKAFYGGPKTPAGSFSLNISAAGAVTVDTAMVVFGPKASPGGNSAIVF